jgi:thiamine biosynthesis lipoprotein
MNRHRKPFVITASVLLAFAALFARAGKLSPKEPWRTSHFENVLGTSMEIKLLAESDTAAERAEDAALEEIKQLNKILSGYDPASEFSRWAGTRDEAIRVSPDLMEALRLWDTWRARTDDALNPAAEAISRVWKKSEADGKIPAREEMASAAEAASAGQWLLDEKAGTETRLTDTPLMLNSFTKSYIVERAAEAALLTPGVTGVVVNIGGDLVVRGDGSDTVDVADPRSDAENSDPVSVLNIRDRAVATSGSYRRGFEIGGQHYSHIVDPRTGQTADAVIGATVVAPNAVDAGALATAFCVLTPEESRKLAASIPGAEYMLMAKNGSTYLSAGWNSLQTSGVNTLPQSAVAQSKAAANDKREAGLWNPGYELAINVEIPQTQGFGARRPYVAVWIDDKDRFAVRTIAVLFEKARWLNELRAWYRDDRLRAMSEGTEILNSVTTATRSPGKYTFKWDGKDNSGKLVKQGRYTVLVEASREHGGNSLVRRDIDFNGEPVQAQAPPAGELGTVAMDYRKVAR